MDGTMIVYLGGGDLDLVATCGFREKCLPCFLTSVVRGN